VQQVRIQLCGLRAVHPAVAPAAHPPHPPPVTKNSQVGRCRCSLDMHAVFVCAR